MIARVDTVTDISDSMREIWLRGPALAGWRCSPGAHVVVRLEAGGVPARRVYSLWQLRPDQALAVLRVLVHDGDAPGCVWARTVRPGDLVGVERPRSKITVDPAAGFHLFAGDETAAVPLLAMRAAVAHGAAAVRRPPVIGVFEAAEAGGEVPGVPGVEPPRWVHRGAASPVGSRVLLDAVRQVGLPPGHGTAYLAGESGTSRLLARHLIEERGWPRRAVRVQQQWAPGRPGFRSGSGPRSLGGSAWPRIGWAGGRTA